MGCAFCLTFELSGRAFARRPGCARLYSDCLLREWQQSEKCLIHSFCARKCLCYFVVQQVENLAFLERALFH